MLHTQRHRSVLYFGLDLVGARVRLPSNRCPILHPAGALVPGDVTGDIASGPGAPRIADKEK